MRCSTFYSWPFVFYRCFRFPRILVNGIGAPGVIPPFALGLGAPLTTSAYGNAIPSLGAFALATTTGMGQNNPPSLRGISNVLLVSNLNEEVSYFTTIQNRLWISYPFPCWLFFTVCFACVVCVCACSFSKSSNILFFCYF